jgi:hypothetical protein
MSATLSLSSTYGSFFWGCTKFAVSPYTKTFLAIASDEKEGNVITNSIAAGVVCGILTFVIPVLPVFASVTFAIASVAMLLAVASMFVTYPIAVIADAISPTNLVEHDNSYAL